MEKFKIKNDELLDLGNVEKIDFAKYVPQIINLANQNAQGTRPKMVGQMSELFPEFLKESKDTSIDAWKKWYEGRMPDAIDSASQKIYSQIENLKEAVKTIDMDTVYKWVEDLIYNKTYTGLNLQELIIKKVATSRNMTYRMADVHEEAQGIDGFIGDKPVSIKPVTYMTKQMLNEIIDVQIIYYDKKKDGVDVYIN